MSSALTSPWAVLGVVASVVLVAFLVNRFAPRKRKGVRRTAILLILYLGAIGASLALAVAGVAGWSVSLRVLAEVLGIFCVINVAGLLLFELGLPKAGVALGTIVADLAIAAGYIVATLAVLRQAGLDLSGIVTTSAIVTGIIALSMQATLGNVVGGVALQLDDSVKPGDWVQLENGKQGRVRQIRWRHTVIETRDFDTLIVPNSSLLAATITILGKRDGEPVPHRMWVYFNVDFRFAPADVIEVVEAALRSAAIEGVASDPAPNCICFDFANVHRDSFGYYAVRYWLTDLARDDPTSSSVRERIFSALKRANIPLAVPAHQIFVEQDSAERRERKEQKELGARTRALGAVELLKPLTKEELAVIARNLRFAPFAKGEAITKQGAVAHWLYILTEGEVEVRVSHDGTDKKVAQLRAPDFFGEMGLMTGEPRRATVVALTDCDCYRLDKEAFDTIIGVRPEIAAQISGLLASRQVELQTVRENLDGAAKARRVQAETTRLLSTIQSFFGLDSSNRRSVG